VETIRTRLDRLYLQALQTTSGEEGIEEDASAAQEELESLYAEILPVAQMSVEQQFLGPALKSLAAHNGKGFARSIHAADYVSLA
jgi:hypothetical protein